MELEDVSEKIEWEARRVAAAFELTSWAETTSFNVWCGTCGGVEVVWMQETKDAELTFIQVGDRTGNCSLSREQVDSFLGGELWELRTDTRYDDFMARGFYRLGFGTPALTSQLPELSAHEKLELRLSMPREFWPKTWLDEEREV